MIVSAGVSSAYLDTNTGLTMEGSIIDVLFPLVGWLVEGSLRSKTKIGRYIYIGKLFISIIIIIIITITYCFYDCYLQPRLSIFPKMTTLGASHVLDRTVW